MIRILFIFIALTSLSWARETSPQKPVADLLEVVRDPVFNSQQRKEALDFSRKKMAKLLAAELNVKESELNQLFYQNPSKISHLLTDRWYDVQTQFYTTLHQENFEQRWIELQKLVKFTDYGNSLYKTMSAHMGSYSPVKEGRYYLRWNKIALKSGNRKRSFNLPYFLMSENIRELIRIEAHVPFEEFFPSQDRSPSLPSLQTFLKNTESLNRLKKQELAEKMELNRRIYIRAVANAAKTIASVNYLSGALNRHATEKKVAHFMDNFCDGCTTKEKKDYEAGAMNYVDSMKKDMGISGTDEVVKNFCSSLKSNEYHWNMDRLKPTPVELLIDQRKLAQYYVLHKLKDKNRQALAKTLLDQDLGILFLTNSLNILDKNEEPVGTRLECTPSRLTQDIYHVKRAVAEAEMNIGSYMTRINRQLMSGRFSMKETNATLDYFVQTNQAATIEATAGYPQGVGWVLKTMAELDMDARRRKKLDKVVYWGGTIIGIGLTITGVAAPEGAAVLAATAGIVKGVAAGSYFLVRSQQEKNFAREMRLAKSGSSGLSHDVQKEHYKQYKTLKVYYIKEFAMAAFSFTRLHRMALNRTGGDVEKAHDLLKDVAKGAKKSGIEEAYDELIEMVLGVAIGA